MAPVLPMTADELWQHLPGPREESVHLAVFPADLEKLVDEGIADRWARLIRLRDAVNVEIEKLRQQKIVGTSLAAAVRIAPRGALADLVEQYREDLPTLFITSQVEVASPADRDRGGASDGSSVEYAESEGSGALIAVSRADGVKCERCWRYVSEVSQAPAHQGICDRCVAAVAGSV
jgi:isoleucyl-tRNA synthetase